MESKLVLFFDYPFSLRDISRSIRRQPIPKRLLFVFSNQGYVLRRCNSFQQLKEQLISLATLTEKPVKLVVILATHGNANFLIGPKDKLALTELSELLSQIDSGLLFVCNSCKFDKELFEPILNRKGSLFILSNGGNKKNDSHLLGWPFFSWVEAAMPEADIKLAFNNNVSKYFSSLKGRYNWKFLSFGGPLGKPECFGNYFVL